MYVTDANEDILCVTKSGSRNYWMLTSGSTPPPTNRSASPAWFPKALSPNPNHRVGKLL